MHILNSKKNEKGFSLIEVVVALSILTMVLSGAITLIVSVVNLNLLSRNKTEAVAYAQEGITIGAAKVSTGCFLYVGPIIKEIRGSKYLRTITYTKGEMSVDTTGDYTFNEQPLTGTFVRVVSLVQWFDRSSITDTNPNLSGANSYQLIQIARNCNE
jgi:prepilin-type N-terminal cleavage/methylation domain-containing protein